MSIQARSTKTTPERQLFRALLFIAGVHSLNSDDSRYRLCTGGFTGMWLFLATNKSTLLSSSPARRGNRVSADSGMAVAQCHGDDYHYRHVRRPPLPALVSARAIYLSEYAAPRTRARPQTDSRNSGPESLLSSTAFSR